MTRRTQRVGSLVREALGRLLLSDLSDPRIDPARTSVVRVEVPEDLMTAKVFVSVLGDETLQRKTLRALKHATGHIQELLGRRLSLKHTPRLTFEFDKNFQSTLEIYRIIEDAMQEIRDKEPSEPQDESGESDEPIEPIEPAEPADSQ
ncbi:MAG: 30S ribosome-binding factor RbfA [Phycisphaerales bacterium]|jgi:ribosome-binding factor A|nr:30S ribosome-binding factor RbfA [Phycisphaerales bacterium]